MVALLARGAVLAPRDLPVGAAADDARRRGCYAACRVVGDMGVGGLVGSNNTTVTASYATGRVTSTSRAGGLSSNNSGTIAASYATGRVLATRPGGLAGHSIGRITSSYWDTNTSGHSTGELGRGLTTVALQAPTGYQGLYDDWNTDLDGDGAGDLPWRFGTSRQYPALAVDADGDGRASWQEFGHQLRAGPRLTATASLEGAQPLVELAWSAVDATHWDPAPAVTYAVTRGDGSTVETIAENIVGLSYTDAGATSGATQTYQVAAVIGGGEAAHSALVTADVPAAMPQDPQELCAFTVTPLHRDVLWMRPSAPLRNSAPCGSTTAIRPECSAIDATICWTRA